MANKAGATLEQRKDAVIEVKFITEVVMTRDLGKKSLNAHYDAGNLRFFNELREKWGIYFLAYRFFTNTIQGMHPQGLRTSQIFFIRFCGLLKNAEWRLWLWMY